MMDGNVSKTKRDERRDRILEIAGDVFYEQGFTGASMSEIAVRLGGSKGTLYNYFESKDELFAAFVTERCGRAWEEAFSFAAEEDLAVRELLTLVGDAFIKMLDERTLGLVRILIAESKRVPQMARIFYDSGPDAKVRRLAGYLEAAKARGEIAPADCLIAARQFLALFRGAFYFETLFGLTGPEDLPRARQQVAAAVDMFMAAYGTSATSRAAASSSSPASSSPAPSSSGLSRRPMHTASAG